MKRLVVISDTHECISRLDLEFFDGSLDDEDYENDYKLYCFNVAKHISDLRDESIKASQMPETWASNINLLNIPIDRVMDFTPFIQDQYRLTQYFTAKGFFGDEDRDYKSQMESQCDFDVKKMTSERHKIVFLKKIMELGGSVSKTDYNATKFVTVNGAKALFKEFNEITRSRSTKTNPFENPSGMSGKINMLYKQLFGEKMVLASKTTKTNEEGKKISYTHRVVNPDELATVFALAKFKASSQY